MGIRWVSTWAYAFFSEFITAETFRIHAGPHQAMPLDTPGQTAQSSTHGNV